MTQHDKHAARYKQVKKKHDAKVKRAKVERQERIAREEINLAIRQARIRTAQPLFITREPKLVTVKPERKRKWLRGK